MRYIGCLFLFLLLQLSPGIHRATGDEPGPSGIGINPGAITSLRVENDLSVTLLLYRVSTHQLIEWPTKLTVEVSPGRLPITGLQVDDDGRYVVFEAGKRLGSYEKGSPPFVYALDFGLETPVRRFLGQGSAPQISADGTRIVFDRTVNGLASTVSLDTRDWQPEVLDGRLAPAPAGSPSSGRPARRNLVVPLLPVEDSLSCERLILFNPNSDETVVTARLQRGFLSWRKSFTLSAHGSLAVDPSQLRRGSEATLIGLSAPLPISAEYRVEETRSGRSEAFGVPALDPETVASHLVFSFGAAKIALRSTLVLANTNEKPTRVRVAQVDGFGSEQTASVRILTIRPRDLSVLDLSPLPAGQIRVEALDRGQVAGTLIVRDGS